MVKPSSTIIMIHMAAVEGHFLFSILYAMMKM